MVVSLGVVAYRIWGSWENIQAAFNWKCLLVLLLFTLYVMGSYITYAVLYKKVLEEMAGRTVGIECISQYLKANLYKYLPGNVMHYVGRNKIAADGLVSYKQINIASIMEILVSIIAASAIAMLLAGKYVIQYVIQYIVFRWIICGSVVLGVVLSIIIVAFRSKIMDFLKDSITPRIPHIFGRMVVIYIIWTILGNTVFARLLQVLGCEITLTDYFPIIGIYSGAWLIWFLTPGVPGGIGVREAMLNIFLSGIIPTWMASLAGVLIRIAQILGELLAYVITVSAIKRHYEAQKKVDG